MQTQAPTGLAVTGPALVEERLDETLRLQVCVKRATAPDSGNGSPSNACGAEVMGLTPASSGCLISHRDNKYNFFTERVPSSLKVLELTL